VQVDPIKPTLKPPGTNRLKLKYDDLLSIFAFKFNLRRYNEDGGEDDDQNQVGVKSVEAKLAARDAYWEEDDPRERPITHTYTSTGLL